MQLESIVFRDHLVRVTIWRLAYRLTEGNYKTGGVARSSNATVSIYVWPTKLFASLIALSSSLTIATIGFVSNESGKLYSYSLSQIITWVFKPSCVISRQITKPMALSSNFVCWNNKIWETLKYFFIDHRLLYYKKKSNISVVWTVLVERKRKWVRRKMRT